MVQVLAADLARAGDAKVVVEPSPPQVQTQKDIPGDFHKYYGQRVNSWKDRERQIAKLDMDADLNYDGRIDNSDPADNGAFQNTPPGLVVGVGEMSRFLIRLTPYRVDFDGEVVCTLEVEGINRAHKTGEFASLEEEMASVGHIRVWRNPDRKELLLDSRDPAKRTVEFTTQYKTYPYNLPITVPRSVYVEGVKASPQFTGDVRLLVTVAHRSTGKEPVYVEGPVSSGKSAAKEPVPVAERAKLGIKSFRTSFDHILITVRNNPMDKEFINGNNEGVWVPAGQP